MLKYKEECSQHCGFILLKYHHFSFSSYHAGLGEEVSFEGPENYEGGDNCGDYDDDTDGSVQDDDDCFRNEDGFYEDR